MSTDLYLIIMTTLSVMLSIFAAWQRHITVHEARRQRRKRAEKRAKREAKRVLH